MHDPASMRAAVARNFDLASALARIDGNAEMYRYFLTVFRDRNAGCISGIRAAIEQCDLQAARILAHSLKSSSATIGAVMLEAAVARLESSLRGWVADQQLLVSVEDEWQQTMASLAFLLAARQLDNL